MQEYIRLMPKLQLLLVALVLSTVQCTPAQRDIIRDVADAVVLTCEIIEGKSTAAVAEKAGVPERVVIQIQRSCACAKGLLCPVVFGEMVATGVAGAAGSAGISVAGSSGAP